MATLTIQVDGMHCGHCEKAVVNQLREIKGVTEVEADFASGNTVIRTDGDAPDDDAVKGAVERAGYHVRAKRSNPAEAALDESRRTLVALIVGIVLGVPVVAMEFVGLHGPVWSWIGIGLAVLLQATVGLRFYRGAIANIRSGMLGMDALISLGMFSGLLFAVLLQIFDWPLPEGITKHMFLEAATLLAVFILLGKTIESRARGKALSALRSLLELTPDQALVRRDGGDITIAAEDVTEGEICIVVAGGKIPVDGEVIDGHADIDESLMTGEPVPVTRKKGDKVFAGTISTNGGLQIKALQSGDQTSLSKIIRMIEDARKHKAPIQRFADRASNVFIPVVVSIAIIAFGSWLIAGAGFIRAFTHFVTVLVIACPCALGIAVPAAVMIASGSALKRGVLVKKAASLELLSNVHTVVFDKTGTLTEGRPKVRESFWVGDETEALRMLGVASGASKHPFSIAAAEYAKENDAEVVSISGFESPGKGVIASHDGSTYLFGSKSLLAEQKVEIPDEVAKKQAEWSESGASTSFLAVDGNVLGVLGFHDAIRSESAKAVKRLHEDGIQTVLLSGDNPDAAKNVGDELGIDVVRGGLTPKQKLDAIQEYRKSGVTVMVGDGINDGPALAAADVGIGVHSGSDVAQEAGDLVLMHGLEDLDMARNIGNRTMRAIYQNLFLSLIYNAIGIPLAAGALVWAGVFLPPSYAALAMVFSDVSVAFNSVRLSRELKGMKAR